MHATGKGPAAGPSVRQKSTRRIEELEQELNRLADGDAESWNSESFPAETRESDLEDILAFESVGTGTSLFEGLQEHGVTLPAPEKLDDQQCADKAREVLHALARLRVFLFGFDDLTAREFYSTLWSQTLWEGCYVEKRNPGAITLIDVSHKMPRSEMLRCLEELKRASCVQ
jgi:hypothetical protein